MNRHLVAAGLLGLLTDTGLAQQGGKPDAKLAALVEQLGSTDPNTRSQAYQTLVRERNADVVPLLDKRIDAMGPDGQQYALYVLQQHALDVTRATYTRLLGADRALLRAHAAAMLVRGGDKSRLPVLAKAVVTAVPADRQLVLNTLYSINDAAITEAVRGYLRPDAAVNVVVSAMVHLRQQEPMPSAATGAAVAAMLTAADDGVRAAALAWSCVGDGADAHARELAKLLAGDQNRFWQVERLFVRDRKYPPVLTDAFAAALAAPRSQYDVTQLLPLLRGTAPDRVVPTLRDLMTHKNADIRAGAISALAALPGALQPQELVQMLQDGAPDQRLAVAAVLRRMDDPAGLPVVLALAQQPGPHRAEALRVLGTFRARDAVPPLLDALDDGNVAVRQAAWTALQQLLRDLFPYRRFDFQRTGYEPNAAERSAGIQQLRAWWDAAR